MGDWVDDLRQWRSGVRLMIASRALYQNHRSFPCLSHIIFSGESYSERASMALTLTLIPALEFGR
jgi:hypothetical protein